MASSPVEVPFESWRFRARPRIIALLGVTAAGIVGTIAFCAFVGMTRPSEFWEGFFEFFLGWMVIVDIVGEKMHKWVGQERHPEGEQTPQTGDARVAEVPMPKDMGRKKSSPQPRHCAFCGLNLAEKVPTCPRCKSSLDRQSIKSFGLRPSV